MRFLRGYVAILAVVFGVSSSNAAVLTFTTAQHNLSSSVSLDIIISTIFGPTIATVGPIAVTGTQIADQNLNIAQTGTLAFQNGQLALANTSVNNLSLGVLGTADVALNGVEFTVSSAAIPVNTTNFQINSSTVGLLSLNQGSIVISDTTGALASLLPAGSTINLTVSPQNINFNQLGTSVLPGTTDTGLGLLDPDAEINLNIDGSAVLTQITGLATVSARLYGVLHVATVIPEVGSMALAGVCSAMGLGMVVVRRRRSNG